MSVCGTTTTVCYVCKSEKKKQKRTKKKNCLPVPSFSPAQLTACHALSMPTTVVMYHIINALASIVYIIGSSQNQPHVKSTGCYFDNTLECIVLEFWGCILWSFQVAAVFWGSTA